MNPKAKLFYNIDTEPNFIALSIIALLYSLKKFNEKNKFKYPQKLASLIYFMNNDDNVSLLSLKLDENYKLKLVDYERLNNIYLKSKLIEPQVNRVLNALNANSYIETFTQNDEVCIYLNKKNCSFIEDKIFLDLLDNAKQIQVAYKSIASIKYETYYDKIFKGIDYYESIKNK